MEESQARNVGRLALLKQKQNMKTDDRQNGRGPQEIEIRTFLKSIHNRSVDLDAGWSRADCAGGILLRRYVRDISR